MKSRVVKAIRNDGAIEYYASLTECCQEYGIRYEYSLTQLIETGGLAPDGKTFFDYPTDVELKEISDGKITMIYAARKARRANGIPKD